MSSRKTNTVPYTNDRLSGRTNPGAIEMRDDDAHRFWGIFPTGRGINPNRSYIRRWRGKGMQTHVKLGKPARYRCVICKINKVPSFRTEQICNSCLDR